jgi:hypothetical protein
MFVCSTVKLEDHVGETYDEVVEVENSPTTDTIQEWSARIKNRIRKLHNNAKLANEDPVVEIYLDGASPYNAMLQNLQIIMGEEEGIEIELPYLEGFDFSVKSEDAKELIDKLDAND